MFHKLHYLTVKCMIMIIILKKDTQNLSKQDRLTHPDQRKGLNTSNHENYFK